MFPQKNQTTFFFSKLNKKPKLELFKTEMKKPEPAKDICDQISHLLNEESTEKENKLVLEEKNNILPKKKDKKQTLQLKPEEESFLNESTVEFLSDETSDKISYKEFAEKEIKKPETKKEGDTKNLKDNLDKEKMNTERKETPKEINPVKKGFSFVLPEFKPLKINPVKNEVPEITPIKNNLSEIPSLIQKLIDENNELKLKNASFKAENHSIELKLEIIKNQNESLTKENILLESNITNFKNEIINLNKLNYDNSIERKNAENFILKIKEEKEEINVNLEKEKEKYIILLEEKNNIEKKIINYEKNAVFSYNKINELEEKNKHQNNFLMNLETENEEYKNKMVNLKCEIDYLKKNFDEEKERKNNQIILLKQEKEKEIKRYFSKCNELENLKNHLNENIEKFIYKVKETNDLTNKKIINIFYNLEEIKENLKKIKNKEKINTKKEIEHFVIPLKNKVSCFNEIIKKIKTQENKTFPEIKNLKDNLQEIYYYYLKEKTDFGYLIEDLQVRHKNEVEQLKSIYSSQIKKIIKHYKGKTSDVRRLIPRDEDMWNVFNN